MSPPPFSMPLSRSSRLVSSFHPNFLSLLCTTEPTATFNRHIPCFIPPAIFSALWKVVWNRLTVASLLSWNLHSCRNCWVGCFLQLLRLRFHQSVFVVAFHQWVMSGCIFFPVQTPKCSYSEQFQFFHYLFRMIIAWKAVPYLLSNQNNMLVRSIHRPWSESTRDLW